MTIAPLDVADSHPRAVAAFAGVVAVSAVAGAIGLLMGTIDLSGQMIDRLPWGSEAFGGVALLCVVAAPFSLVARAFARGSSDARRLATVAGGLLVGWIVVETAMLRSFSPLQPLFLCVGAVFMVVGRRSWRMRVSRRKRAGSGTTARSR